MVKVNFDRIKMVLLDLDGTLLNNSKLIGDSDNQTLKYLGERNILRVFATGRTLYSAKKVLSQNTPLDYLVFSSGAGVYDWKKKELLFSSSISVEKVHEIIDCLRSFDVNFSVQFAIPDNHKYVYYKSSLNNTDFEWRNAIYKDYNSKLVERYPHKSASQFIVILPDMAKFDRIKKAVNGLKVIRATSPIDGKSVWLEIFNNDVSKAKGGIYVGSLLGINQSETLSIGNDYNDLDLLNWTKYSFVVENAPDELKNNFDVCSSNQNNPLTDVLRSKFKMDFEIGN